MTVLFIGVKVAVDKIGEKHFKGLLVVQVVFSFESIEQPDKYISDPALIHIYLCTM